MSVSLPSPLSPSSPDSLGLSQHTQKNQPLDTPGLNAADALGKDRLGKAPEPIAVKEVIYTEIPSFDETNKQTNYQPLPPLPPRPQSQSDFIDAKLLNRNTATVCKRPSLEKPNPQKNQKFSKKVVEEKIIEIQEAIKNEKPADKIAELAKNFQASYPGLTNELYNDCIKCTAEENFDRLATKLQKITKKALACNDDVELEKLAKSGSFWKKNGKTICKILAVASVIFVSVAIIGTAAALFPPAAFLLIGVIAVAGGIYLAMNMDKFLEKKDKEREEIQPIIDAT